MADGIKFDIEAVDKASDVLKGVSGNLGGMDGIMSSIIGKVGGMLSAGKAFEMMSEVISHFMDAGKEHFSLAQILDFLQSRPDLVRMNQNEERKYWQLKDKPAF